MRVLYLTHAFPRHPGDAAGSFILRLAGALRAAGVQVLVLAPSAPALSARSTIEGIRVRRFRYAPRSRETLAYTGNMAADVRRSWRGRVNLACFLPAELLAALRVTRLFRPDAVHAHWWFPSGVAAWGSWLARRAPLVTTLHGSDVRLARGMAPARALFRAVARRSASVTAVSRWLADEARHLMPSLAPIVAPMPAATELFAPGGSRAPDRLLFVGRLTEQKGLDQLLRALPLLHAPASLDVVGSGPAEADLQQLAAELGVADRVRWHHAVSQEALVPFYQGATALVVPSIDEGLGLVAVEAQLCGTPVVASQAGGLTDVVTNGETGLLVPPGAPAELAAAIDGLLSLPERGAALGHAGRRAALAVFSPAVVAARYLDVYRSVCEARRA